jgi:Uma2 family endonuclease
MTTFLSFDEDLLYPESDGEPMAESTEQYRWIVMIKENLEIQFANQANVFIAADLFWYPIQVKTPPAPRQAPDVMVVFGRPKGGRRSYKQWEENDLPAQVVFEILSASNKTRDGLEAMDFKFLFYQRYGVEEYYIYDPDEFTLEGWQRQGSSLVAIPQMAGWVSPRLDIQFEWQPRTELVLLYPDRQPFLSSVELAQRAEQAQQRAEQAQQRAEQAQQRAEQAQQRAEQAEQTLQEAVPRLLSLGLGIDQIAHSLGLARATVQSIVDEQHL